jgi:ferredoxin
MTPIPGTFAAGDFVTGPSTIIEAIADGRTAAAAIHRYLAELRSPIQPWPEVPEAWPVAPVALPPPGTAMYRDTAGPKGELSLVAEVEDPPEVAWAVSDSLRCLYCGLVPHVIFDHCTACQECTLVCPVECIDRVALNPDNTTRPIEGPNDIVVYEISGEECIRCGRCFGACPTGAIVVDGFSWQRP